MTDKKTISSSKERQVLGYLKPGLDVKFKQYVQEKDVSISEALNDAVRLLVAAPTPIKK
jgi:hypothetical protein